MATIKLNSTKTAARAINYAKKEGKVARSNFLHTNSLNPSASFKAVRMAHNKNDGIQAHTVIQSFVPGETTPKQANDLGMEFARKIAEGHQIIVYTHTDKEHIHNHIIINSVNMETGKKFHYNRKDLYAFRDINDALCLEAGLSVPTPKISGDRLTQAEIEIKKTGRESWKENIRNAVIDAKSNYLITSLENYQEILKKEHDIDLIKRGKTLTYAYNEVVADDNSPLKTRKVRGSKLGADYELEQLNQYFERQEEIKQDNERLEQQKLLEEQQKQASMQKNIKIREEYEKIEKSFRTSTSDVATRDDFLRWQKVMSEQEARHDSFYTEQALADLNEEIEAKEQEKARKPQEIERTVELAADKQQADQEAVVQEKSVTIVDNTRFDVDYTKKIDKKSTPAPPKEEFEEFDFSTKEKRNKFRREFTARTGIPYKEEGEETAPRKQKTKQKDDGLEF